MATSKKLREPFNIFPDGSLATKVVGLGFAEYDKGGGPAVVLIFATGKGQTISVNLPNDQYLLDAGEFHLKDWSENEHVIARMEQLGILQLVDKPTVPSGQVQVRTVRVDPAKLTNFTPEEAEKYKP